MIRRSSIVPALLVSIGLAAAVALTAGPAEDADRNANQANESIQSIRGIEGIDAVQLQNLETVLRMQTRPTEEKPRGTVRAAAALTAKEDTQEEPTEQLPDARMEYLEFEMEGS